MTFYTEFSNPTIKAGQLKEKSWRYPVCIEFRWSDGFRKPQHPAYLEAHSDYCMSKVIPK